MYRGTQSLNKMFNATGVQETSRTVDSPVIIPINLNANVEREPSGVVIDDRGPLNIQQVDITESTTTVSENVPTVTTTTFGGGGGTANLGPLEKTEVLPAPTATKQSYFTTKNIIIAVVVIVVLVAAYKYFKKSK
jgi:hypothetical protein